MGVSFWYLIPIGGMNLDPQEETKLKEEFLQHLRYYRHDFLNHIQLLKGYLTLKKIDEAEQYLNQIVDRAEREAQLFQIGDPCLAYSLHKYRLFPHKFELEVQIDIDPEQFSRGRSNLSSFYAVLQKTLGLIEEGCQEEAENHLWVIFREADERLMTTVKFKGKWEMDKTEERLGQLRETICSEKGKLVKSEQNQDWVSLNIEIYA